MSLFDDFSKFLETRLEEFLRNNPDLELEALLDQLNAQLQDNIKLIAQLKIEQKKLETEILSLSKDIQTWHARISKAEVAGRLDLAQAAREREASLLRQGNLVWGQRSNVAQRLTQAQELFIQIEERQKEVKVKLAQVKANKQYSQSNNYDNMGWHQDTNYRNYNNNYDALEEQFQRLETDDELEKMKRNLRT